MFVTLNNICAERSCLTPSEISTKKIYQYYLRHCENITKRKAKKICDNTNNEQPQNLNNNNSTILNPLRNTEILTCNIINMPEHVYNNQNKMQQQLNKKTTEPNTKYFVLIFLQFIQRASSIRWRKYFTICSNIYLISFFLIMLTMVCPCYTQEHESSETAGNLNTNARSSRSFYPESSNMNLHRDNTNRFGTKYHNSNINPPTSNFEHISETTDTDEDGVNENEGSSSTTGHDSADSGIPSCSSCIIRKQLKIRNLEFIKNQVLRKLGFEEAPNITSLPKMTPARMQEVIKKFGFSLSSMDPAASGMQGDDPNAGGYNMDGGFGDMWSEEKTLWKEGISVHEENGDDFHAKTEKIIAFAQPYPRLRHGWKEHSIMQFRFSDKTLRHRIKEAILNVYVNPPSRNRHRKKRTTIGKANSTKSSSTTISDSSVNRSKRSESTDTSDMFKEEHSRPAINNENDYISVMPSTTSSPLQILEEPETITVSVYKAYKNQKSPDIPSFELISSENVLRTHLRGDGGRWIPLDISPMLSAWFKAPRENWGFVVRAEDENGIGFDVQHFKSEDDSKVPYVELYTIDMSQKRKKRSYGLDCTENSHETRCCRYPLTVDFQEFGWDWIIAPKQYRANYCSGECGYVFLQKFPHTHIASLASPTQPDTKPAVEACCAPRKMSPISMLYFDHELNIIYGTLPNMVVDRCGCS